MYGYYIARSFHDSALTPKTEGLFGLLTLTRVYVFRFLFYFVVLISLMCLCFTSRLHVFHLSFVCCLDLLHLFVMCRLSLVCNHFSLYLSQVLSSVFAESSD